jgi:3-hydroxyisobutyrate dehydrogenase-like beta-hydroxyacid dehydrogenase
MNDIKVGFIGLGNMGITMARALVRHNIIPTVYDLRQEPVDELVSMGAKSAKSCKEVAELSDVIISMVWDIPQTEEVIFGKDGVWEGIREGSIIIITSSIGPDYCQDLYEKAKEKNVRVADCAVSGGMPAIDNRPSCLMIGGDDDVIQKCWPLFEAMGEYPLHLGGIGMGQAHKLVDNLMARHFGTVTRLCLIEGLNFGLKVGLDLEKMMKVAGVSAFSRGVKSVGLEGGFNEKRIVETIRSPMPLLGRGGRVNELNYARELAEKVGAPMPLFHLSDEINIEKTFDSYYELMKKYLPEQPARRA